MTTLAPRPTLRPGPPGRLRRARQGPAAIAAVTVLVLVVAWELVPRLPSVNRILFPTFSDVAQGFVQLLGTGYWWSDLGLTMFAVAVAWVIGVAFGFTMGVLLGTSALVRQAVTPYAIAVQALPKVVLAPLLIGWLGFGPESKIALAVIICFFPVWVDTMVGLALPGANEFKLLQSLKATRRQIFFKLQLPSAVPMIMVGVKHALLLAFTGVLVAEILSASEGGLGKLANEFASQLNMPLTYSVVLVVVLLAVALVSVADRVERRVVFWSEESRGRQR